MQKPPAAVEISEGLRSLEVKFVLLGIHSDDSVWLPAHFVHGDTGDNHRLRALGEDTRCVVISYTNHAAESNFANFRFQITAGRLQQAVPVWLAELPTSQRRIVLGYALSNGPTGDTPDLEPSRCSSRLSASGTRITVSEAASFNLQSSASIRYRNFTKAAN